jgi:hypothetical protein
VAARACVSPGSVPAGWGCGAVRVVGMPGRRAGRWAGRNPTEGRARQRARRA